MKLFHLSDLHIGLKLMNRDLAEDQAHVFSQIAEAARLERPDAILIAGDVYDKAVPSAEAVAAFDSFIALLRGAVPKAEIMVVSGNHDSAARLNLFRGVLGNQHIHMIGLPPQTPEEYIEKVTLEDDFGPVDFYLLPFVKPSMVKPIVGVDADGNNLSYEESLRRLLAREAIDETRRNVLVSHQFYVPVGTDADSVERMGSETCTVGNIDAVSAALLSPFDYAALGHIHKPTRVGGERWRYCGTPLACSVSESGQEKGVVVVEMGPKGDVRTRTIPLVPMRQVRVISGALDDVLAQACWDYVSVVLRGDTGLDAFDLRDRVQAAFPNLLEIRRELPQASEYGPRAEAEDAPDPLRLCEAFLGDLDDEERALLSDVVNAALEVRA